MTGLVWDGIGRGMDGDVTGLEGIDGGMGMDDWELV